jgi:hypothetical protein
VGCLLHVEFVSAGNPLNASEKPLVGEGLLPASGWRGGVVGHWRGAFHITEKRKNSLRTTILTSTYTTIKYPVQQRGKIENGRCFLLPVIYLNINVTRLQVIKRKPRSLRAAAAFG